jgi:hypothetical protein
MIGLEKISRIADIIVIIIQDNMVRDNVIRQCRCMGVEYNMLTLFLNIIPLDDFWHHYIPKLLCSISIYSLIVLDC